MSKISIILMKIISILLLTCPLSMQFYIHTFKIEISLDVFIILSIILSSIGWINLIKTNNPIDKNNPFTINTKWKNKMEKNLNEDVSQLFSLDKPDIDEVRNKKIKNILK